MIGWLILITHILGWMLLALAGAGTLYLLVAAHTFRRFMAGAHAVTPSDAAVTLLKPLHGDEPRLVENLESFLVQDHHGPVQLLCGVARSDDPAIAAVERLRARHPHADITLVIDARLHGSNRKVSNLVNMEPHIRHPVIVLSDSDMAVPRDYLARILDALDQPGVGGVTCLYHGRGDAGFWSRMVAAMIGWQFLPGVVFGYARGLAQPCMGSTIALRHDLLKERGGFAPLNDILADDYALGAMIHDAGLDIVVPPMLVTHAGTERNFSEAWAHELRWSATVRGITPAGHAGAVIAMPFPMALIALGLGVPWAAGGGMALLALAARLVLARQVDSAAGGRCAAYALLPLREAMTFAVFIATYFTRSVDWRGAQLNLEGDGRIAARRRQDP